MVGWKVTKFSMSYLKPQVRFFLNFASLFSVMREFFCTSLAETLYDLDKWNPSKCKIPNLCLDRLSFCWKYMEFKLKNHREFMSQSTKDWYKARKKTWFFVSKVPTLCWILTWALEIFKFPLWLVPFAQSIKYFTKKTPEELSFMTLISDAKLGKITDLWFGRWLEVHSKF